MHSLNYNIEEIEDTVTTIHILQKDRKFVDRCNNSSCVFAFTFIGGDISPEKAKIIKHIGGGTKAEHKNL